MQSDSDKGTFAPLIRRMAQSREVLRDWVAEVAPVLERELKRRGIYDAPPGYLGYPDRSDWSEGDGIMLLAHEFGHWTLKRIESLHAKLDTYGNIDPMIIRNVRYYVTECQQIGDPVGYSTFENVRGATKEAITEGWIEGDHSFRSAPPAELVFFPKGGTPDSPAPEHEINRVLTIQPYWLELIRKLDRRHADARRLLKTAYQTLFDDGIKALRVQEVARALRDHARVEAETGWSELEVGHEMDEAGQRLPVLMTEGLESLSEWWAYEERVRGIRTRIARLGETDRAVHIRRLFEEILRMVENGDNVTQRELGRRIGLKRSTISDYIREIRMLWNEKDSDPSSRGPLRGVVESGSQ